jgi:hypothetical protein
MLARMRTRRAPILLAAVTAVVALVATGCSEDDGCRGATYDPDLDQAGSATPIEALDVWMDAHEDIEADPPVDGWSRLQDDDPDADTSVIENDDAGGWWVTVARTTQDGWVVTQATDTAEACGDKLDG